MKPGKNVQFDWLKSGSTTAFGCVTDAHRPWSSNKVPHRFGCICVTICSSPTSQAGKSLISSLDPANLDECFQYSRGDQMSGNSNFPDKVSELMTEVSFLSWVSLFNHGANHSALALERTHYPLFSNQNFPWFPFFCDEKSGSMWDEGTRVGSWAT